MTYPCTLMDPPWPERGGGKSKRGADRHYNTLTPRQIYGVILECPFWKPALNAHLWCWTTNNHLLDGLWLVKQLGFRYVTNWVWVKGKPVKSAGRLFSGSTVLPTTSAVQLQAPGLGQYSRGLHELLLFGVRGKAMLPPTGRRPSTVIVAPRREHSRKPDEQYDVIERVSPGPRVELFARERREGWDSWGDEL